jgi:formylglycine-generating enzyme required for sulfatase activity
MHGNVWEWCQEVVMRGGSWADIPDNCRSAFRYYYLRRVSRYDYYGFRVVCDN